MGTINFETICRMRDLAVEGVHPDEIARRVGVCRKTVTKYVGGACQAMRRGMGKSSVEEVLRVREMVRAGGHIAAIARMMYISEFRAKQLMVCAKEWGRRRSRAALILRNRFESHRILRHALNHTMVQRNRKVLIEKLGDVLLKALRNSERRVLPRPRRSDQH